MDNLLTSLSKMQEVLAALQEVMAAEQQQLSAGNLNSSLLQRITEDKQSLLSTLNYFDAQRREAETAARIAAPYGQHSAYATLWQAIQHATLQLRDTNVHNGMLLEQQLAHNNHALAVLKPHQSQKFYGPDGRALGAPSLSRKA
ncbi:flagellar biosynthesis protein FlgN [Enterobacterales bacterium CwR94]|nr:flagellar biosynthesis protein FlgN [Enterobacterales bacterium CwR94]